MQAHGLTFCLKCQNMLYVKTKQKENKQYELLYYCKNCGEEYDESVGNTLVYDKQYQSDLAALRYEKNNHLVYDVSIPHIITDCINKNCITNSACRIYVAFNYDETITDLETQNELILDDFTTTTKESLTELKLDSYDFKNIASIFTSKKKASHGKILKAFYNFLNENKDKYNINVIREMESAEKDVLFIKYDKKNLKYLYKCCNCFTTWKNK